jgi:hypothetical protein
MLGDDTDFFDQELSLNQCHGNVQGFIWLHLVLVTEFAIFSVRAPRFFWQSMPSPLLIGSVSLTCDGSTLIAHLVMGLEEGVLWVWIFNIIVFILVDLIKVLFKLVINEDAGETIDSDELVQGGQPKSETTKHV